MPVNIYRNQMHKRRSSGQSYQSSCSSYMIQDENNESLFIHHLKERPQFNFQMDMTEKEQFQTQRFNPPHDQKEPFETVQDMLYTEEKLELNGKQFNMRLKAYTNFINIKLLNLSSSQIASVPTEIRSMMNLKKLVLNSNRLHHLPNFIQDLRHLESLEVADNQLSTFSLKPVALKHLNIAANTVEQLFFPSLEHLCIQMNPFTIIPKGFNKVLYGMTHLELDWFKYCRPALPQKLNFEKYQNVKDQLIQILSQQDLDFKTFVAKLSLQDPNFELTDYKDRNLFALAAINNEIGILKSLMSVIPQSLNKVDFDQLTPLSCAYSEGMNRSVDVLLSLGGRFSSQSIITICQKIDQQYLRVILSIREEDKFQKSHSINEDSLAMFKNIDGNTPLHIVFMNFARNTEADQVAQILLSQGANPNAENHEGLTPLDLAVRKGQIAALRFAMQFNQSRRANYSDGKFFNFNCENQITGWTLVHQAASVGNLEILEFLNQANVDMFQVTKCNRLAKNMAIQSLSMLKNMRKLEKRWILSNVIMESKSQIEQAERNVYQMKHQIEKNMAKKHENMIQKIMDQEDEEQLEISSYNENSLRVASENSIKEIVTESAPIFQRSANKQVAKMQLSKQNMEHLNQTDFTDQIPEILKLLRNQRIEDALQKLKNALISDMVPLQERVKYKNQLIILKYKFKNRNVELKGQYQTGVQIVLNEYQFSKLNREQKGRKELKLGQFLKFITNHQQEDSKSEQHKLEVLVKKVKGVCEQKKLHQDLLESELANISELRARLSNNLVYDITNYGEGLSQHQDQVYYWVMSSQYGMLPKQGGVSSNLTVVQNFEGVQRLRCKSSKRLSPNKQTMRTEIENLEQDMIEPESCISTYNQLMQLQTPFQTSRRQQ